VRVYRKTIELDRDTDYWFVKMGPLNHLNEAASYPFPTYEASERFAINHKMIAKLNYGVDREVVILHPDGTEEVIE